MAQQYFQLDSGVLQQYGRPPTPSVTKDAFGSAMRGVETGMRMGYAYDANRRANEELEEKKKTRDDVRKRWEEEQRLAKEKEATRQAEFDREQTRLEAAAEQAKRASDAQIEAHKAQRAVSSYNLKVAQKAFDIKSDINDDATVVEAMKQKVSQAMGTENMTPGALDRATLDGLYASGEAEDINPTLMDALREGALTTAASKMDQNNMLAMHTVQSLNQNNPLDAVNSLNKLMTEVNVVDAQKLPPNQEDPKGGGGYIKYKYTEKDSLEEKWGTTPVDTLLSNVAEYQNTLTNNANAYLNYTKRKEAEVQMEFRANRDKWTADTAAEVRARDMVVNVSNDQLADGSGWHGVHYKKFMATLDPEEQVVTSNSITRTALSLVALPGGPGYDEAMDETTAAYIKAQQSEDGLNKRENYGWVKDLFGMYSNPGLKPAVTAPIKADGSRPVIPRDMEEAQAATPEGTVPRRFTADTESKKVAIGIADDIISNHAWSDPAGQYTPAGSTSEALEDVQNKVYSYLTDQGFTIQEIEKIMRDKGIFK